MRAEERSGRQMRLNICSLAAEGIAGQFRFHWL